MIQHHLKLLLLSIFFFQTKKINFKKIFFCYLYFLIIFFFFSQFCTLVNIHGIDLQTSSNRSLLWGFVFIYIKIFFNAFRHQIILTRSRKMWWDRVLAHATSSTTTSCICNLLRLSFLYTWEGHEWFFIQILLFFLQ